MTQRVRLDNAAQAAPRPSGARPENPQRNRKKKRWYMTKKEKIVLISLASVTVILLVAAILMITSMFAEPTDDGKILKGVVAAGVNLGGMTPDEAAIALQEATADTYSKLDMVVTVLDSQITLSPEDTGASLDIQAVIADAFNYGRTGSRAERNQAKNNALTNSVIIPITPHLNLNTDFIRSEINKLGTQFSSTLQDAWIKLEGQKPQMSAGKPDTSKVYQTLTIYVGTAEYGLDTNKLYEQVLEYYNINIFQVVGTCTVLAPESIEDELLNYHTELYEEPVDAQMDPVTYEVTPEIYGYGFDLNKVKEQIAKTPYGQTITIPVGYLAPNITKELLAGNLFQDVLGAHASALGAETAWNSNAYQACEKLNGLIIKAGETFSFNDVLGELTEENGYQEALAYRGNVAQKVMGGGVTHVASVLYNSVLESELEILERHNHTYATNFIEVGRDVYVAEGKEDFRFRNNRSEPIRITAAVTNGNICVSIEGTDNRNYSVEISVKVIRTIRPGKLYNVMVADNPGGYKNGQELVAGVNGYEVEIYNSLYTDSNGQLQNKYLVNTYTYEARDSVVVKLEQKPTEPPASSTPSTPSSSAPSSSTPPASSTPSEPASQPASSGSSSGSNNND